MKASLQMEGIKTVVSTDVQPQTSKMEGIKTVSTDEQPQTSKMSSSKMSSRRMILMCVLGITAVLVIVAVVLGSLYFGATLYGRNDHGDNMENDIVNDNREVTMDKDTTAEIENSLNDDTMSVIKDYEREIMVYHVPSAGACYVARMNPQDTGYSNDTVTEEFREGPLPTKEMKYKVLEGDVDMDTLSSDVREMCADSSIARVVEMTEREWAKHPRHKRAAAVLAHSCHCCCCCKWYCCCCAPSFTV